MHIFYTPGLDGDNYILSPEESKHCLKVLRLKRTDRIVMTNGKGGVFTGEISGTDPKGCEVKVVEPFPGIKERTFHLHIAIAPTKNIDRIEWFLEKCTEMGVDEFTLLHTVHSERDTVKLDRLEKVIISAMKQSLKGTLPQLNPMVDFETFIRTSAGENRYIAHCMDVEKKRIEEVYRPGTDALILIGPEGDFSPEEAACALSAGFIPISLGESRLRTETAGIVACHTINFLNKT